MKKTCKKIITVLLIIAMLIPLVGMLCSSAAINDFSVELAFNNIFVFDKWAGNKLSTTIVNGGMPVTDKLNIDVNNGSFKFTNPYSGEAYTGHGMGSGIAGAGNFQYYMMDVEADSMYVFSYELVSLTSGLLFTPYVFFFDENGSYTSLAPQSVATAGKTDFVFFTPENARYIQIRFTISGTGSAEVKDIAIRKTDKSSYSRNIFNFSEWSGNSLSAKVCDNSAYNGGTLLYNSADNSVTLTTNSTIATKGVLFSNFTFGNGNGYYMIPVECGATYSLSYNLSSCNFDTAYYQPYIVFYGADGNFVNYTSSPATGTGDNKFVFTVPEGVSFIQIVYGIVGIVEAGKSCTVKDVVIQKLTLADEVNAGLPPRKVYTYSKSNPQTYGELPVPSYAPEGYVFAGWYTGLNGTGTHITENTPVDYTSYTVYPKYEPKIDSLCVKAMPAKTSYSVGERVNPTGLVLEATTAGETQIIESGYYCTPEHLTSTGPQTVTAHYGGQTATYTVDVSASFSKSVVVNGVAVNVSVTNNVYSFANTVADSDFHRYKLTYYSDSYVEGIITYGDGTTEQFFLEPSYNFDDGNGEFTSFVDSYLKKYVGADMKMKKVTSNAKKGIKSISFELLDNKTGTFELLSVATEKIADMPATMTDESTVAANTIKTFENNQYRVGIDILNGGAVYQLYLLNSNIVARVYNINGKDVTKVDYKNKLNATYGRNYKSESASVNLINYYDNGRELQQSYYGTGEKPYEQGYYNSADWNYNPVQAGNVVGEASKVIDYEIGEDYIYIKARPLDWAKWSDEFANLSSTDGFDPKYGDEYVTDTYIEAKYVFENGLIKTYCRMVDYSGLPSAQTTQELPAFYTIEPLNQYVYNNVTEDKAWQEENLVYDSEPEFWGITPDYIKNCYPNGFSANKNTPENWAAFMASQDADSFGIGLYSPEVTDFYYGVYPSKHSGSSADNAHYRHAMTTDPAKEVNTSYIAPIGVRVFESYAPTEYEFYISTGTVEQIRDSFNAVENYVCEHDNTRTEHKDATCSKAGYNKVICNDCGETVSTTVIPPSEHTYTTITTEPTCVDEGSVVCLCTVCGYEYVGETLAPKGHSDPVWATVKAPTSTNEGVLNQICTSCDKVFATKTIPVISFSDNSVANLDFETNIITGFEAGSTSIDDYLSVEDDAYTFNCKDDVIGTDTVITLTYGEVPISEYIAVIFGDVNGDGWYDGTDSIIVSCLANGLLTQGSVSEAVYMAADCNHDGTVDSFDVALLEKAGLLLANVDQSKSKDELATDSDYIEYLDLIDQTPEEEENSDTNDEPESDKATNGFNLMSVITTLFSLFKKLFSWLASLIA